MMPTALEIVLTIIAVLLWFIWQQLSRIAGFMQGLYTEAKSRRSPQ